MEIKLIEDNRVLRIFDDQKYILDSIIKKFL